MYFGTQEHEGPIMANMITDLESLRNHYSSCGYEKFDYPRGGEEGLQPHELEVWSHESEPDITIVCLDASQNPIPCTEQ